MKLISAKNSKQQSHPYTTFARATIKALKKFARLLWPGDITFYSQDNKSKLPIGLTTAKKQALLLMHMEYKATLHYITGQRLCHNIKA